MAKGERQLLFAEEFGWVDVEGALGGHPRGKDAEQNHGQHYADEDDGVVGSGLVDDVGEESAGEDTEQQSQDDQQRLQARTPIRVPTATVPRSVAICRTFS